MSTHRADIRAQGLEQRAALREGAREHALHQRREERWAAAQAEAVTNGARFPDDPYPVTLAEVCARQDAQDARLEALERWQADATGQTERM